MWARLRILHGFNLTVFVMFVVSLIMNSDHFPADQLSQTFLALLIAYPLVHLTEALLLARYGNEITVMWFTRKVETSTSRTLELVASGVILLHIGGTHQYLGIDQLPTNNRRGRLCCTGVHHQGLLRRFSQWYPLISGERMQRGDVTPFPMKTCSASFSKFADCKPSFAICAGMTSKCPPHAPQMPISTRKTPVVCSAILWISKSVTICRRSCKNYLKAVYERACQATDGLSAKDTPVLRLGKRRSRRALAAGVSATRHTNY